MKLCQDLGLNPDTYSVSILLGSTINMAGAAVTINVLTLAAVNTLGISVDFGTAFVLSVVAAISAGASGIAGDPFSSFLSLVASLGFPTTWLCRLSESVL